MQQDNTSCNTLAPLSIVRTHVAEDVVQQADDGLGLGRRRQLVEAGQLHKQDRRVLQTRDGRMGGQPSDFPIAELKVHKACYIAAATGSATQALT